MLHEAYNTKNSNPVNLCEACASGGRNRCMRNDEELYYGNSGAFRCLTECEWKVFLVCSGSGKLLGMAVEVCSVIFAACVAVEKYHKCLGIFHCWHLPVENYQEGRTEFSIPSHVVILEYWSTQWKFSSFVLFQAPYPQWYRLHDSFLLQLGATSHSCDIPQHERTQMEETVPSGPGTEGQTTTNCSVMMVPGLMWTTGRNVTWGRCPLTLSSRLVSWQFGSSWDEL